MLRSKQPIFQPPRNRRNLSELQIPTKRNRFVGWSTPWPDSFGVLQRACLLGSFCPLQFEISSPTRCNVLQRNQNNHSRDWLETSSGYENYKLINCFPNKDSRLPSTLEPVLHQQLISMFLFHLTLFQRLTLAFNTHQPCDLCDLCILSDMWRRLPRHHSFLLLCFSWVSGLLFFWCNFSKSCKNSCCSYTSSPSISNNIIDRYIVISHDLKYPFSRKSSNILDIGFCHVANHLRNSQKNPGMPWRSFLNLESKSSNLNPSKIGRCMDMITTQWLHLMIWNGWTSWIFFWLRIPQVDDLARLKVVGTRLANFKRKKTRKTKWVWRN